MEELARRLRDDIEQLCDLGPRSLRVKSASGGNTLDAARHWLIERIGDAWRVAVQPFDTPYGEACNLELRHPSAPRDPAGKVLVVGAHYDTVTTTPGADDNGSAVACLLYMLGEICDLAERDRVRFVLYANEEPPYFRTPHMGSLVHAGRCKKRRWKVEMLCLESLGYYSDEPNSQIDPSRDVNGAVLAAASKLLCVPRAPGGGLLGDVGDFLVLEADLPSAGLLRRLRAGYGRPAHPRVPAVRLVPVAVPQRYCSGLSDHWSYWHHGYPAVMATDTAVYRNPNYHKPSDTPDTLDYVRLAAVAARLTAAVRHAVE